MSDCCAPAPKTKESCCPPAPKPQADDGCCPPKERIDYLFYGSLLGVSVFYLSHLASTLLSFALPSWLHHLSHETFDLMNQMWWGLGFGILFVGIVGQVPRQFVMAIMGPHGRFSGLLRATGAGLLLDLCSHGILLVAMRLYERGASLGQTIAFLVASPWNSFSLTLILWSLIGLKWTLVFIAASAVVALISGAIFEGLVAAGVLPKTLIAMNCLKTFGFGKRLGPG